MSTDADLKQELLEQLKNSDSSASLQALETIKLRGWLHDGALVGCDFYLANLPDADLSGADLRGADLRLANLSGANISKANLSEAHLNEADLRYSNLSKTDLFSADLSETSLLRANLSRANLGLVNLYDADLRGARLIKTRLVDAFFEETLLAKSNWTQAVCGSTVLANVNLSSAKGLESVRHIGPSTIGVNTLYRSKGKIPEFFLRGCGIPEEFIRQLQPLLNRSAQFHSCFISYDHNDRILADRLYQTLTHEGIYCFIDDHGLEPREDLVAGISRNVRSFDRLLVCCSKASLTSSWWVDFEVNEALRKEHDLWEAGIKDRVIIPIDLDGYLLSETYKDGVHRHLSKLPITDFRGWEDNEIFNKQVEKVIRALRTEGGKEPPIPKL